jgi:hypothetical protein
MPPLRLDPAESPVLTKATPFIFAEDNSLIVSQPRRFRRIMTVGRWSASVLH